MAKKKVSRNEWKKHKGKALIMIGLLAVAYGALRTYGLSAPQTIMVVGGLLVLKGLIVKTKK